MRHRVQPLSEPTPALAACHAHTRRPICNACLCHLHIDIVLPAVRMNVRPSVDAGDRAARQRGGHVSAVQHFEGSSAARHQAGGGGVLPDVAQHHARRELSRVVQGACRASRNTPPHGSARLPVCKASSHCIVDQPFSLIMVISTVCMTARDHLLLSVSLSGLHRPHISVSRSACRLTWVAT